MSFPQGGSAPFSVFFLSFVLVLLFLHSSYHCRSACFYHSAHFIAALVIAALVFIAAPIFIEALTTKRTIVLITSYYLPLSQCSLLSQRSRQKELQFLLLLSIYHYRSAHRQINCRSKKNKNLHFFKQVPPFVNVIRAYNVMGRVYSYFVYSLSELTEC